MGYRSYFNLPKMDYRSYLNLPNCALRQSNTLPYIKFQSYIYQCLTDIKRMINNLSLRSVVARLS